MARSIFDKSEWDFFWRFWDEAIQRIPDLKREALEAMGKAVLQEVRGQISRRGVNDPQGWVARWQEMRMGSKGGYVAAGFHILPALFALPSAGSYSDLYIWAALSIAFGVFTIIATKKTNRL